MAFKNEIMCQKQPPGWGEDPLSEFIARCFNNTFASYVKHREAYSIFLRIDILYRDFISALCGANASDCVRFLLCRSYYAFLGATRLALSTQVVESYMLARGCLEAALYGLHMHDEPSREQIWIHRHDNDDSKNKARNEFGYKRVKETLKNRDLGLYETSDHLYQLAIDCGGHPNERAITANLKIEQLADFKSYYLGCLVDNEINMMHSFKMVADVGSCALEIFGLVFPDEFREHGINTALKQTEEMINQKIKLQNP